MGPRANERKTTTNPMDRDDQLALVTGMVVEARYYSNCAAQTTNTAQGQLLLNRLFDSAESCGVACVQANPIATKSFTFEHLRAASIAAHGYGRCWCSTSSANQACPGGVLPFPGHRVTVASRF